MTTSTKNSSSGTSSRTLSGLASRDRLPLLDGLCPRYCPIRSPSGYWTGSHHALADLRQHFVEEDAEQLATFRAAPILRQFGHQRVCGGQDDAFVLHPATGHFFGDVERRPAGVYHCLYIEPFA